MMTVRSPAGLSIQFNDANYVERLQAFSDLYSEKGGFWIAQVPIDWIIEIRRPCRVYRAGQDPTEAIKAVVGEIEQHRHALPIVELRDLKRALSRFNAKTWRWR